MIAPPAVYPSAGVGIPTTFQKSNSSPGGISNTCHGVQRSVFGSKIA